MRKPPDNAKSRGRWDQRCTAWRRPGLVASLLGCCLAAIAHEASAQEDNGTHAGPADSRFLLKIENGAITSLRFAGDTVDTDYANGQRLGDASLRFRIADADWRTVGTAQLATTDAATFTTSDDGAKHTATYRVTVEGAAAPVLLVRTEFTVEDDAVVWNLALENRTNDPLEISDLSLPMSVNRSYGAGRRSERILKHSFISGHGSFLFWMRQNTVGPYLTLTPSKSTSFEFWDGRGVPVAGGAGDQAGERTGGQRGRRRGAYSLFVHSAGAGENIRARGGRWRLPHTQTTLAPMGQPGDKTTYGYTLHWADHYDDVRQIVADKGLLDVHVVPGMTVPSDLSARFAIRSSDPINAVEAEFPDQTQIESVGKNGDYQIYEVKFAKLGENLLTVTQGDNRRSYLEFFVTEPLETLIKKRGAFLAKSQHRDPSKWYNGLITDWNMRDHVLPSPDNYDLIRGFRIYAVTCDDPGLAKPAYLAAKLAEYPDQGEVEALDYYIENFVWGGLQRTTDETYPYGIYGIQDWKRNRDSDDEGPDGQLHLWRCYDYPHIIVMYYHMYRVAKNYPQIETKLTASEYLKRAHGTAAAFFTVPMEIRRWSPYGTGFYNELVIPEVIEALESEGMGDEAAQLRGFWERKVNSFVSGRRDLFRSEYAFDSTGFESTHALVKYALNHADSLSERFDNFSQTNATRFLHAQMGANLFCRGWLEPAYYLLGSDYRGGGGDGYVLTYMSQMGGWSVLDYGLNFADRADQYLRLGYASYLSAWALMNSGTPESDYGYWFPGPENDGGAGGGFEPAPYGSTWLGQPHNRGSWLYSCEIDVGYCGALRTAATLLADDDIFGRTCYGGEWRAESDHIEVTPKDGLRRRFYAMLDEGKLQMTLSADRFIAGPSIRIKNDFSEINFDLERANPEAHTTKLYLTGLPAGTYSAAVNGASAATWEAADANGGKVTVELPIPAGEAPITVAIARSGA